MVSTLSIQPSSIFTIHRLSYGNFDKATLVSILENHVTKLASYYKGQLYAVRAPKQ